MIAPPRPPSHDELEALIKEARERQHRRRLLGATGAAIAAAMALGIYALIADRVAHRASSSPVGGVPLCASSQLSGSISFIPGAENIVGPAIVSNTSGTACALPAERPVVHIGHHSTLARTTEVTWPVSAIRGISGLGRTRPEDVIAPGATAAVWVTWSNLCPNQTERMTLVLDFPGGPRIAVPETTTSGATEPGCVNRNFPSRLGVSPPVTPPPLHS